MPDEVILGVEILGALICAGLFVIAVTGRRGFNDWETRNLNRVAIMSGIIGLAACGLLAAHLVPHAL